jgi:chitinase
MWRRQRSLVLGLVAALVAGVTAVAAGGQAFAAAPTATFTKVSDWGSGWEGRYTIVNGDTTTMTSWTVAFDLPAGANITTFWDADMTRSGQRFTFRNRSWNGNLPPGASASFGFNGSGASTPSNCTLNGASCGGGTPNPTVPGQPGPPSVTGVTASSISLSWGAAPGTVTGYRVYEGTTVRATVTGTSATITGLGAATTHTFTVGAYNSVGEGPRSAAVTGTTSGTTNPPGGIPRHALIGYLHASFANGSGYLRMADVPAEWDIINLAFGEPTSVTSGDIRFQLCPAGECPGVETEAAFIAAIRAKQQAGKKVLISIGGQNGQVQLTTTAARDRFVSSVAAIIDRYGLDGLDIDFEGHSLSLNTGDTDFRNPTTPVIVNLISAIRSLKQRYGSSFVLTMAPETFFVQLGYQYYGSGPWGGQDPRAGSYLPVIHALRNDITVLHVQDYNSGPIMGLDNQYHTMGGADFHIAMTDMLLAGFPVAGNTANVFAPLREDQVAFGTPSSVSAGNGYTAPAAVQQAVNCLVRGTNCGGYTPRSGTNPAFRGLMTWSINWDRFYNWEFKNNHEPFLNALP